MSDPADYLILVEQGPTSWGAWSPDLPGCIAAGDTKDETVALMREAISGHLEVMAEHGDLIPEPSGPGVYIEEHTLAA
jgi:predicted RNase H-like HicB family nuclease